ARQHVQFCAAMDHSSARIAVVIPSYRTAATIAQVVAGIPEAVEWIIVVDDACPEKSGDIAETIGDPRIVILRHPRNQGVGGAVVSGYREALARGADIVVKMDGDDQMDPAFLHRLIRPLTEDEADYAKGNRFHDFAALRTMPRLRLLG